jgi:chemotaxis-related protein WspB
MLVLMCHAGGRRYAIESRDVVEVVSYVKLEHIPESPSWIAGVFAYRGRPTPVVDLPFLVLGSPCPVRWSTRVVITRLDAHGRQRAVGLLVEQVTTAELKDAHKTEDSPEPPEASTFGSLLLDDEGMFQLLQLPRLLPSDRRRDLFPLAPDND